MRVCCPNIARRHIPWAVTFPRIDDKTCFTGMVYRLTFGCSWEDAGMLVGVSQATLRRRRDEWIRVGLFDRLAAEAVDGLRPHRRPRP